MSKFVFIMQHDPTPDQLKAAAEGNEVVQLDKGDKKLLIVPDDSNLGREWFAQRADEIIAAVGGLQEGDILHCKIGRASCRERV